MLDIIMACFNPPNYLQRMLESIKTHIQDLSQIDVYVVDDCSNYSAEYQELIKQYNASFNCHYLKTEVNSGPAIARNLGLNNSHRKFVTFVDDDDEIISDILKFCNNQYDMIVTFLNFTSTTSIETQSYINPVYGIVFNRNFLNKYKLQFPLIQYGMEDSIFRSLCFILTNNILRVQDKTQIFYYRHERKDSCFSSKKLFLNSEIYDITKYSFDFIADVCWLAILSQELEQYCQTFPQLKFEESWNQRVIKALSSILSWKKILIKDTNEKRSSKIVSEYYLLLLHFLYISLNFKILDFKFLQNERIDNNKEIQMLLYFLLYYTEYENNILTILPYNFLYSNKNYLYQETFHNWSAFIELTFPQYYQTAALRDVYIQKYYTYYAKTKEIFI